MNNLTVAAFEEMIHDSFMNSSNLTSSVEINRDNRFMLATLTVSCGIPVLNVTVLNLVTKLKEYDSIFRNIQLIKSILGHHSIPENIQP